jgi:hypothetical protein
VAAVCSCQLAAAASLPPHYASHRSTPATTAVYAPYPSTDQNPYPSIDTSSFYPHLVSVVRISVTQCRCARAIAFVSTPFRNFYPENRRRIIAGGSPLIFREPFVFHRRILGVKAKG